MLLFAHTGITVGCVWLAEKALPVLRSNPYPSGSPQAGNTVPEQEQTVETRNITRKFFVDYRLLLVGSMLPDILDKPLGVYLLADEISNGRIFGHTLLFTLILLGSGLFLFLRRARPGLLVVALGVVFHVVLDQMWKTPETLLWPLFGFVFSRYPVESWLPNIFENLVSNPAVFIPEIIGAMLLAAFFISIMRKGRLAEFIKTGRA